MTRAAADSVQAPIIGAELAVARERAGRSLDEFAATLRIRRAYLQALEDGRVGDLPGGAYPVAFLRSYALALGLDADAAVRRFKAEAAELDRPADLSFPAPLPQRGRPLGALMMLGLGLAVLAYAGWYHLSGEGRLPAEAVQPVPARLARLVAPKPPAPAAKPKPKPASGGGAALAPATPGAAPVAVASVAASTSSATPPASPSPTPSATPSPTPSAAGPQLAAATPSAPPISAAAAPPASASVPPGSAAAAMPTAAEDAALAAAPALAVHATADAWIEVRDAKGNVLFSHLLHAGDSWTVPPGPALVMTTGNAGGTELVTNGVASPPLGPSGAVLRNVPLSPPPASPASAPPSAPTPAPAGTP